MHTIIPALSQIGKGHSQALLTATRHSRVIYYCPRLYANAVAYDLKQLPECRYAVPRTHKELEIAVDDFQIGNIINKLILTPELASEGFKVTADVMIFHCLRPGFYRGPRFAQCIERADQSNNILPVFVLEDFGTLVRAFSRPSTNTPAAIERWTEFMKFF